MPDLYIVDVPAGTDQAIRAGLMIESDSHHLTGVRRSDGGEYFYDVVFDVQWVDSGEHHTVTVHAGTGSVDMLNWYTQDPHGWPQSYQDEVAAHEAGHMFGNWDEYPGGAINPDGTFGDVNDSLMGDLSHTLYARHFQFVVDVASAYAPSATFTAVVVPYTDDTYEENDTLAKAWDFFLGQMQWLSSYGGDLGIEADDDWYETYVDTDHEHLVVDLTFIHAAGGIDIEVVDPTGTVLAGSYSASDNEHIDTVLPTSGYWYLRVFGDDAGNAYDLWWDNTV